MDRRRMLQAGLGAALGTASWTARPQAWPERVVTLIDPYLAGGAADGFKVSAAPHAGVVA